MKVQKRTDIDFIKVNPDFERYVRVHSGAFAEIFDKKMKDAGKDSNELEGLVKISYADKNIYRKCIGANINSGIIELGYRTKSELRADYGDDVDVEPANWFMFYWNNSDSYIKYPFQIALIGGVITIFSFIISIASLIISIMCCDC